MCPSLVRKTPVGMLVGWSLPACSGTSRAISQRAAWKSSIAICAARSELSTHWPWPDTSRSKSATRMPIAQNIPAVRSATGMPTRTGPCPGRPVIDIKPAHSLRDLIEAWAVAIRPALPKAGNAGIDQARVDRLQRLVVDAEPGLYIGPVVLDDDIRVPHQLAEDLDPLGCLEIQRQAALVAVQVLKIGTVTRTAETFAGPGRRLDLDHLGAPIGELAHRRRTGADAGQVEDLEPGKRQRGRIGHRRSSLRKDANPRAGLAKAKAAPKEMPPRGCAAAIVRRGIAAPAQWRSAFTETRSRHGGSEARARRPPSERGCRSRHGR